MRDIILKIEQRGEKAVKGVSAVMQKGATDIRDLAIEYAPIDTGDLENAITKSTNNTGVNRRAVIEVYIDETGEAGKYAANVHEHLLPFGDGKFGRVGGSDPESLSAVKDAGRGVVGGLFLKRAYEFYKDKIRRDSERIVSKAYSK